MIFIGTASTKTKGGLINLAQFQLLTEMLIWRRFVDPRHTAKDPYGPEYEFVTFML